MLSFSPRGRRAAGVSDKICSRELTRGLGVTAATRGRTTGNWTSFILLCTLHIQPLASYTESTNSCDK